MAAKRLLKEDQRDQCGKVGHIYKWCLSNQVNFGAPPVKSVADFLRYPFQDRKLQPSTIDGTGQPLLINWETHPLTSAKMKVYLVSWIVSTETDPKAAGKSPPGSSRSEIQAWQNRKIRHQSYWSKVFLFPSSSSLSKKQLSKEGSDNVAQWLYQTWPQR